jgi:hypothetical protein
MIHGKTRALRAFIIAALLAATPIANAGEWERPTVPLAGFRLDFGGDSAPQFSATGAMPMLAANEQSAETDEWQNAAIFLAVIGVGVVTWAVIELYDDDNY